jgi:two-component system phosphate regulon sensor histidine kinase PhoR
MSMIDGERTDSTQPDVEAGAAPAPDRHQDTTHETSRNESNVRVLLGSTRFIAVLFWLTVFIGTLLFVLPRYKETARSPVFLVFVGLSIILFLANYFFPFEGYHPVLFILLMIATNALIASLVYLTGGSSSNLFLLYMAVLLFSAAYLEMIETILVAVLTAAAYFAPVVYGDVDLQTLKTMTFTVPIFIVLTLCGYFLINKARQHASEKDTVTILLKEADLKRQELATLYSSSLKLATTLDHYEIGETLIAYTTELLPAEKAFLLVGSGPSPEELVGSYGITPDEVRSLLGEGGGSPFLLAAEAVLPVIVNAEDDDERFQAFIRDHPEVGSLLSVPLFASSRVIGLICCLSSRTGTFNDESARLLLTLASQAAVAIEKSILYRTTLEDKLKIEAIINSLNDGIIVVDEEARLVLTNPSVQRFLGITAGDFGAPAASVFNRLSSPWGLKTLSLEDFLEQVTVHGESAQDEIVMRGEVPLHFQLFGIPLKDQDGSSVGSVLMLHDITDLARLDELKSDFISIVSHELKTPLTSIRGFVKLMNAERVGPVTDKQRHYLDIVENQAESLTELVNDLLDLSKIESGVVEVRLQPLSLQELLDSVVLHMQGLAADKGISIITQLPDDLPPVDGDRERLNQVFFNLIGNSLKFTDTGGTITVDANAVDGHCLLRISDTGIGIPATDLARIFDKFYQVESSLTRQRGGTGLGLAISKQLINAHGGEIWARSKMGEGTTFFIRLRFATIGSTADCP